MAQALMGILAFFGLKDYIYSYLSNNTFIKNQNYWVAFTALIIFCIASYVLIESRWIYDRKLNYLISLISSIQNDFVKNKDNIFIYSIISEEINYEFSCTIEKEAENTLLYNRLKALMMSF